MSIFKRLWFRNLLFIQVLAVACIVGFFIGKAYGVDDPIGMLKQSYEPYVHARPASTTTTTTTQPPKKKAVRKASTPPVEPPREVPVASGQDWISQCNVWMDQLGVAIGDDRVYAIYIIDHESDCFSGTQNPHSTAYGIGQFLDSTWKGVGCIKTPDPLEQLRCMNLYVQRYGGWRQAYEFKRSNGWY